MRWLLDIVGALFVISVLLWMSLTWVHGSVDSEIAATAVWTTLLAFFSAFVLISSE